MRACDAMTREVISIGPDEPMSAVRRILRERRISGLPVVEGNRLVGIISIENLIQCLVCGKTDDCVRENMTPAVQVVFADEPLIHALRKFEGLGFGRFPVLDRDSGALIGMLTKGDIIRCLLQKLETAYSEKECRQIATQNIFADINADTAAVILTYNVQGGDFHAAGQQASLLKQNLRRLGFPPVPTRRSVIAACEAEMNIILFAESGEIEAQLEPQRILIRARDKGPGIPDVEKAMQPGFSTAPDWVREMGFGAGMGLPNIKKNTDMLKIDSRVGQGTTLEFMVRL